jgi:hypothetical protein
MVFWWLRTCQFRPLLSATKRELLKAKQDIPLELQVAISDPEAIWKAEQEEIKKEEALQRQQLLDETEVTIVVDTTGDQSLGQDFMSFPDFLSGDDDDSGASDASDESGLYNSDNEYSWNSRV